MTKRLIALLLSLVMLLGCLIGCGEKDDEISNIAEEGSEKTITLSMYLMSEEKVSDEQALAIQNAVNKITKSKFKTQLILHYFTEDEYYLALEKAYDDSLSAGVPSGDDALEAETGSETAEETYVDEYGVVQLKYPTIPDYQVDIFYLSGYDKLSEYIEYEMVQDLSTDVDNSSKVLKSYIHPSALKGVDSVCNGLYAIPANGPIGEYTYMLLNKQILKEYNHTANDFSSVLCQNAQYLLDHVSKYNEDFVPFRSFTGGNVLDIANVGYIGVDDKGEFNSSNFSLVGSPCNPGERPASQIIFNNANYNKDLRTLVSYKEKGYYGTEADANKPFAMGYIKGGLEVVEQYGEDYEIVVAEAPTLNTMDLFQNMFAVSSYSSSLSRSMQILTYLYTNKDFNNLLLYGIEGENYEFVNSEELDENEKPYQLVKPMSNNKYVMAPEKLGNVLLANPTVGQSPRLFDMYKQQNIDALTSPLMGMVHDFDGLPLIDEYTEYLREKSKEVLAGLLAVNTVEEFDTYFQNMRAALNADAMLQKAVSNAPFPMVPEEGGDPVDSYTIAGVYTYWLKTVTESAE